MKKRIFIMSLIAAFSCQGNLQAHCQLPCGIYHDDIVFDQIDQYIETVFKGITVLNQSKFATVEEKNEFVRWVIYKETASDEASVLITKYFLQQKMKPGEPSTVKQLETAHKLLFLLVKIKQNADLAILDEFSKEWEKFKLMFHVEGYEYKMKMLKMEQQHQHELDHDHDHDHDHDDSSHQEEIKAKLVTKTRS